LYEFWGDRIARQINRLTKSAGAELVVNLASQEYFQAVDCAVLKAPVVTPIFKEKRGHQLKVIGIMAKRARGAMARYLVETQAKRPAQLKDFRTFGYRYQPSLSDESNLVYVRAAR
ncbi:MAG TPA: peroxide stress protein YaaA, partial [Polyangiaceae bacterium]|nr:peroxide stress protein YaaA [Polyangiaceae bacterium]